MYALIFVALNIFAAVLAFWNFYFKRRKFPPGPTPLPILGNLLSIQREPGGEDCYVRWAKKYGPIFTFWMGEQPVVMMTDIPQIVDTFLKDGETYAGRIQMTQVDELVKGGTFGIINTEGELWRDHRRFALHVFRDFGIGKNVMQDKILTEMEGRFEELDEILRANPDEELDFMQTIDLAVGSIINSLLFGYRFTGKQTSEFFKMKRLVAEVVQNLGRMEFHLLCLYPPLFSRLPFLRKFTVELREEFRSLHTFVRKQIEAHEAEIDLSDLNGPSTDYVEAYIKEREKRKQMGDKNHLYHMDQLIHMLSDLWGAGQETTSTTLAWGIAYILHNPHVQDKLHAELDAVIGTTDRFITVADRPKLPYVCAAINEFQRIANLLPINLLHRTLKDTTINGFFIPQGTCVIPQISAILHTDEYFHKPREFNPDRFLTADGQLKKCDEFIPFGIGKRQCLGESLARMELFLITANIFNRYKVSRGSSMPSLKREFAGVILCPRFMCKVQKRK